MKKIRASTYLLCAYSNPGTNSRISEKNWTGVPLQLASHLVTGDISFTHSFFYGFTEVLFDVMLNDIEYDVKQNSQYVIKESVNEVNLVSGSLTPHLPGAPGQGFSWSSGGSWVTGWYLKWALPKFCGSLNGRRADVRAYGRVHGHVVVCTSTRVYGSHFWNVWVCMGCFSWICTPTFFVKSHTASRNSLGNTETLKNGTCCSGCARVDVFQRKVPLFSL